MKYLWATTLLAVVLPLSSCQSTDTEEVTRKPVPPPNNSRKIAWNSPVPGQGGGAFSAMPNTPRR